MYTVWIFRRRMIDNGQFSPFWIALIHIIERWIGPRRDRLRQRPDQKASTYG